MRSRGGRTTERRKKASNRLALLRVVILTSALFFFFLSMSTLNYAYGDSDVYHKVTFDTFPRTVPIIVDGVTYLPNQQPVTFNWLNGTSHEFKIGENITNIDSGRRYRFEKWNDGYTVGDTRTINVTEDMSYIAIFKPQYYLKIESRYGEPEGEGWYDKGSTVSIRVEPLIEVTPERSRRLFVSWDQGSKPWSNENSIMIFSPTTVTATWKTQYRLDVTSDIEEINVSGSGWYDEGSDAHISTDSEHPIKAGEHKYTFNRWVSTGANQPTIDRPDYPTTTIKMKDHYSVRATWSEMWHLTIKSDPPDLIEGGESGWYTNGSTVTVGRAPDKSSGYKFLGWWVDGKPVADNPLSLNMFQSHIAEARYAKYYSVIFDTYPRVSLILIDGQIYLPSSLPKTFDWIQGSEHTFGLPSTTVAGPVGTRYVFTGWNDLQNTESRRITVDRDAAYTALLKTQHYLTIISQHGSPVGEGWYDSGSIARFSIEPLVDVVANKSRHVFVGWDQGQTRWSPSNSIDMSGPTMVTAQWKTQYWLGVSTSVEGTTVKGGGWYDEGSRAQMYVVPIYESERNRHKYTFKRWSSDQQTAAIDAPQNEVATVLMDSYYDIRAEWDEWYYLDIESIYGEPEGEGYYLKGSEAIVSVTSPFAVKPYQSRMVFVGWSGHPNLEETRISVLMDSPKTLTAQWKKQYYLKIVSAHSNVQGAGWYDEGGVATLYADRSISAGIGRWTVFQNWSGDLLSDRTETTITMDSPHTVYANWRTDSTPLSIIFISLIGSVSAVTLFVGRKVSRTRKEGARKKGRTPLEMPKLKKVKQNLKTKDFMQSRVSTISSRIRKNSGSKTPERSAAKRRTGSKRAERRKEG